MIKRFTRLCTLKLGRLRSPMATNERIVGSGSVSIPDYRNHPMLGEPIADDPLRSGPLFEASWTHALHCVSRFSKANSLPLCSG
jgi:hypothetical protein